MFSIDPTTARDLDDALHVKRLDDGMYEVGFRSIVTCSTDLRFFTVIRR